MNNEKALSKQVLYLSNLSISVPELLFNPSDAGLSSAGIAEAIIQSVNLLPRSIQEELLRNIFVIGGVAKTKGLIDRLTQEVQENSPTAVRILKAEE